MKERRKRRLVPPAPDPAGPPLTEPLLSGAGPISGNLDAVQPDGTLVAWCWSPGEPAVRREVGVWIDGIEVARAHCDRMRPDLLGAGVGDGAHGLVLPLAAGIVQPGHSVTVTLRDVATDRQIGRAQTVTWEEVRPDPPPAPSAPPAMHGNLDGVTKDGFVSGWCWYPAAPDEHIGLTILVDDEPVGTTAAAKFRADLKEAGIGDGTHGFVFALPWSALADKVLLRISVRETQTRTLLGEPVLMRAGRLMAAEERIQDLERQIRRLRAEAVLELGFTADPDIHLLCQDEMLRPELDGTFYIFRLPQQLSAQQLSPVRPDTVVLCSRFAVPAELGTSQDPRRLGVAVSHIEIGRRIVPLDHWSLREGWHPAEPGWRWTNGAARLLLPARAGMLRIRVAATLAKYRHDSGGTAGA